MRLLSLLYAILLSLLSLQADAQAPIQGNSNLVEFAQKQILFATNFWTTSTSTVTVSKIQIPSQQWRKPYVSISTISGFRINQSKKMQFYFERFLSSATQFTVKLQFTYFTIAGTAYRNWPTTGNLKFYYLLLSGTLPDKYVSDKLMALDGANPSFPGTWRTTHTYGQWTGSAALNLLLPGVRFVHALTYHEIDCMTSNNKFSLNISFIPVASNKFNITVYSPLSLKLNSLRLNIFIYDQAAFSAIKISIRDGYQEVPAFAINDILQHFTTGGWPNYPGMTAVIGLAGYEFSTWTFGFDLRFNKITYSDILTVTAENLMPATIAIPKILVSYITISQPKCPNNQPLVDQTLTTCILACPPGYNPSTTPVPYIGLYSCVPCSTCCPTGQYLNGACITCATNCQLCSTGTNCISCQAGFVQDSTGACVASIACTAPCLTCDASGCNSCSSPYIVSDSACACPPGTVDVSGSCDSCTATMLDCILCSAQNLCDQCDAGFYKFNPNTCKPCTRGCISCDGTGCLQCVSIMTLDASKLCVCLPGYFYNSATVSCDQCSAIAGCTNCTSTSVCTACAPTYYLSSNLCNLCSGSIANCSECNSASTCTKCDIGFYVNTSNKCQPCGLGCEVCTSPTACTQCEIPLLLDSTGACVCQPGFYFDTGSTTCVICPTSLSGCNQCSSSSVCTSCQTKFYLPSGGSTCLPCSANCIACDNTGCKQCLTGFYPQTNTSITPSIICKDCKLQYGSECLSCDTIKCKNCAVDSFWWLPSNHCILFSSVICGDGTWIDIMESCDDGNLISGDGCNSLCQVETDYVCLLADRLPSGVSLCKFTKDLSITFDSLTKKESSNTIELFLNLQPATFTQWDSQAINNLLSPIEIINQQTGAVTTIPINSLSISFIRNPLNNQVQLTIDYGKNNLEGSEIKFNINPMATNLQSLQSLPVQNNLSVKLQTKNTGIYLYGYDESMYSTQSGISGLSNFIGSMSIILAFLGLFIPSGKLIIVEALAVIQISYFSVLQFQKIPPTYTGFKNLVISNGFNDPSFFSQSALMTQNIYKLMGLETSVLSNFNISLIMFVFMPAMIGGVGLLITKYTSKSVNQPFEVSVQDEKNPKIQSTEKENEQNELKSGKDKINNNLSMNSAKLLKEQVLNDNLKQSSVTNPQKPNDERQLNVKDSLNQNAQNQTSLFKKLVFERILYENTLYGIFMSSYLAWVSIFHSFTDLKVDSVITMLTFCGFVFGYGFLFYKAIPEKVALNSLFKGSSQKSGKVSQQNQEHTIMTGFGQFSVICHQPIQNPEQTKQKIISKIALIFILERLLSGICVVFISPSVPVLGVFIALIETGLLVGLVMASRTIKKNETQKQQKIQEQKKKQQHDKIILQVEGKVFETKQNKEKPSALLFFYKNYLFRQGLNCGTIILVQIMYMIANITMKNQDSYETFVNNSFVTTMIPLLVCVLLSLNMALNWFLWINEVRFDQLLSKAKLIWERIFPRKKPLQINIDEQSQISKIDDLSKSQKEEEQVVKRLNKFIQTSTILRSKQSPFLGIQEKEVSKEALLGLLKVEESHKVKMSATGQKIRNKLIDDFWDEI